MEDDLSASPDPDEDPVDETAGDGHRPLGERLRSRRVIVSVLIAVVVAIAVHVGGPALAGAKHSLKLLGDAHLGWIIVAGGCSIASFACYIGVFHLVVGEGEADLSPWHSTQIALGSQAASTVITAGGAGGIGVMIWVLLRRGLSRGEAASQVFAFLAFHYAIYLAALAICGSLLWLGVLPGPHPTSLTLLPAVVSLVLLLAAWRIGTHPGGVERVLERQVTGTGRAARLAQRVVRIPEILATGLAYAAERLSPRPRGIRLTALAFGYWAFNIAILGFCFLAFDSTPNVATLVQAFFIGSTASLLPLLPGGIGSAEAGLIGALIAFGHPGAAVVVSVLAFRLLGFWIPTLPEAAAYARMVRTIDRWPAPQPRSGDAGVDVGA